MTALEATMEKHDICIDSTSSSSSHGNALSASDFSFNTTSTSTSNEWLIDSGASYHMAKDRDTFSSLNECNTKKIFVGDDRSLSVEGSGTTQVENSHFNDVLCLPSLSCNFLSVYQITHSGEGKTLDFSPHRVVIKDIKDLKNVLATGISNDITRLYKFDNFGLSYFSSICVAHSDDLSKLWHDQFGHLNYRPLQKLCNQKMVTGLSPISCRNGVCASCVLGKHHRDSFDKRASWHTSGPLHLVHSDLCGPLSSPSFSGCKYFLTFIDDFSRRTWVYFLKLKRNVFDKFLAYKTLVENKYGHQIQRLRTDNGGEYVNNNFTICCTTHGIQMQHTVPSTPHQNGVAKRKNRTLKEMSNCMIQSKGLSLKYWAEAINCENYIVNHTPTKALTNITLEEAWTKIKPDVSHLCLFGSIAFLMRKGKHCILKVRSVYLLVILKMSKVINLFNHIVMKLLLEEMLNLMKISCPVSLIQCLCLLWPASLIQHLCLLCLVIHVQCLCLLLFWFLLQMMIVRIKIHLYLLTFLEMSPLNQHQLHLHYFLDGSVQHEKQLVIFSVILHISIEHIHSSNDPLLFWLNFQRLVIQRHLQKLQVIQIRIQQWMKSIVL
jgi:hypothetical protein